MNNELFILMDDSGVLTSKENTSVYGGLFFYSAKEYNTFLIKYKSIINSIKCKYCKRKRNCNNKCPEIKGAGRISNKDRRRIFNLLKKQKSYGVLINNQMIFKSILNSKASRGRFCDYAQKRVVKEIVSYSIKQGIINNLDPVQMHIMIDQSNTKSNGYYNLYDSIFEELVHGIKNYNYPINHKPILKGKLNLKVNRHDSKMHYGIQSADMIANFIHRKFSKANTEDLDFITIKLFLP